MQKNTLQRAGDPISERKERQERQDGIKTYFSHVATLSNELLIMCLVI